MFGLEPDISLTDSRVKLSPPLSLPDLIRQSRDSPVEPGNDEKEKKHGNDKKEKSRGVTKKIEGTGMTEEKKKLSNDRNKYFI